MIPTIVSSPLATLRANLIEVLDGVERRFARRAEEEGRVIEVSGPSLEIGGDRQRLDQAIGSVVDNALRYGTGVVSLTVEPGDGEVRVYVRDHGPGFPAAFIPRAFERFSRADSSRRDGGSGLGLAIVSTVIGAHGGEVRAANWEGGAEVRLTLPRVLR